MSGHPADNTGTSSELTHQSAPKRDQIVVTRAEWDQLRAVAAAARRVSAAVPLNTQDFPPDWERLARTIEAMREVLYLRRGDDA